MKNIMRFNCFAGRLTGYRKLQSVMVVLAICVGNAGCENDSDQYMDQSATTDTTVTFEQDIESPSYESEQPGQYVYSDPDSVKKASIETLLDKAEDIEDIIDVVKDIAELLESEEESGHHSRAHNNYQYWDEYFRQKGGNHESAWRNSGERESAKDRINKITETTRCGCAVL